MIKRNLYSELKQHLTAREMTLVVGPRQSGKTTLLRLLAKELEKTDKNVLFLNLDVEADAHHFQSQQHLIRKIELEFGSAREGFVFIDEIQRKENAGIFLKGLYDQMLPYKFIVSGSGSLELKEKIQESLAGRKRLFELSPVTFDEFVHYQTEYKYADNFSQFVKIERERLNFLLIEYMNFGGYPRIVTESDAREKYLLIDEIFRSYVEKDLVYLLHIDRPEVYRQLIRLLANQTGKLVNFSKLAANLNVSLPTVKKYIWFAQKTFIIDMITPFARNFKKEITRSPMTYFWDLGLCLFSLGRFGGLLADAAPGFLFQNFVYNLVKQKCNSFSGMLHFLANDGPCRGRFGT